MAEKLVPGGFLGAGGFAPPGGGPPPPPATETLAQAYAAGLGPADQTFALLDAPTGGGITVNGLNPGFTGNYGFRVFANEYVSKSMAIGVDSLTVPTARLHIAAGTAAVGTAPLKIDAGVVLAVPEIGAIESNGTHIFWTDGGGVRHVLDTGLTSVTLAQAYAFGAAAPAQTPILLDAKGGGIALNATTPLQTFVTAFEIDVIGGSVNFYRVGGFDVESAVSVAAAAGAAWNEVNFLQSTITLTGGPATVTKLAQVRVGSGIVNGAGNTVTDSYDLLVDAAPSGTATLTRAWSFGVAGKAQFQSSVAIGAAGFAPTARLHLAPGTIAAGTASLKIDPGVLLTVPESGAVESTGTNLWWTDGGGVRHQLDNDAPNLATIYNNGASGADQTLTLQDANGGAVTFDALALGPLAFGARAVRIFGGCELDVSQTLGAGPGQQWLGGYVHGVLTLTGAPAAIGQVYSTFIGGAVINGVGNTIGDAHNLFIDQAPNVLGGDATVTRGWALGTLGSAIHSGAGLVLRSNVGFSAATPCNPPGESDLVISDAGLSTSAQIVSEADTGRLGYRSTTQQFYVSMNGGAYVPLLTGPASGAFTQGSVPFAGVTGVLTEDNADLFWDATNKRLGIDVAAAPTARLHLGAVTAGAGTASVKIDAGVVLAAPEVGAIESDGTFLYWTDSASTRIPLNQNRLVGTTVNVAGPYVVLATDAYLRVTRTATAPISINLPAIGATTKDRIIAIGDAGYNAAANNITLVRSGADKINNVAGNYTMAISGGVLWLVANQATGNWELV
jgi:hypothetical protein